MQLENLVKKIFRTIAAIAFGAVLAPLGAVTMASAAGQTIYVGPTRPYTTISAGINAANDNDVVRVDPGTYTETLLILREYISIIGSSAGSVIVQAPSNATAAVLTIFNTPSASGKTQEISGLTLRYAHGGNGQGGGITLFDSSANVHDNIISDNQAPYGAGVLVIDGTTVTGAPGLSNPTIQNNIIRNNFAANGGGGIFVNSKGDAQIIGNTITGNSTSGHVTTGGGSVGGGIWVYDSTNGGTSNPVISGNTIQGNTAEFAGGGIVIARGAFATVADNLIDDNTAPYGGGVHIEANGTSMTLLRNTITNNDAPQQAGSAGQGGGIAVYDHANATISENLIQNNTAQKGGAGIAASEGSTSLITRNTVVGNKTDPSNVVANADGGGLLAANATITATNNVFAGNEADLGGGLNIQTNVTASITNNTIVGNWQDNQQGGAIFVGGTNGTVKITNNIVAANQGFQIFEASGSGVARINNNLFGSASASANSGSGFYYNYGAAGGTGAVNSASAINGDSAINADGNVDGNPQFTDLFGGDYTLGASSAAVDAGTSTDIPAVGSDIRGVARSGSLDIGAYEYSASAATVALGGTAAVSKTITVNASGWGDGAVTYQWSIDGVPVSGATGASYSPRLSDVGHTASVYIKKVGRYTDSRTSGASAVIDRGTTFADVSASHPFYANIEWMFTEGISTGSANGDYAPLYKPEDAVSRQAMAAFLFRYSGETFTAPTEPTFADVASTNQFYTAIEWMAFKGISVGTTQPEGKPTYNPGAAVSRQSMATFLARYAGADISVPPTEQSFADVPLDANTAAAIEWMKTTGISTGTPQASGLPLYRPVSPVSRQAMAAFLNRLDELPPPEEPE